MEDPNSTEAIKARAEQYDPIIMYLIVRESLNMSIGKTAAQCAHAAQMLQLKYQNEYDWTDHHLEDMYATISESKYYDELKPKLNIYHKWLDSSFRKVVLRADEKEWGKLKQEFTSYRSLVVDAGLTELEPNTETVIGLWPMYKSQVPKLVKRLQVLK